MSIQWIASGHILKRSENNMLKYFILISLLEKCIFFVFNCQMEIILWTKWNEFILLLNVIWNAFGFVQTSEKKIIDLNRNRVYFVVSIQLIFVIKVQDIQLLNVGNATD